MNNLDATIHVGFDGSPDPNAFAAGVSGILSAHGTINGTITGDSYSPKWGAEPAAWYAVSFASEQAFTLAKRSILTLAAEHNQDAVAFTVGTVDVAAAIPAAVPA